MRTVPLIIAAIFRPTTISTTVAALGVVSPVTARGAETLLAPKAQLEKVADELAFGEGPAWHPAGHLLFEDIPRERILKLDADGTVGVFREPSGGSNGLAFDGQGRLLAAEGARANGNRRVSRTEKDGRVVTLADRYQGKRLNSPNDLTVDRKGRIYFTDPRYGDRDGVELDKEAVYRIDPDGALTRVIDTVMRPNGIALSPDGKTLYVAESAPERRMLLAFDLRPDGSVTNERTIFTFSDRGTDGMTVDARGRLWATAGEGEDAGIHVFALDRGRRNARRLTIVHTPERPTNCTFGGPRRDWLYITTGRALYRIRTATRGAPSPPGK